MPLKFAYVCDLFERLSALEESKSTLPSTHKSRIRADITRKWFYDFRGIMSSSHVDPVALLSTLLPERRVDRVYSVQEPRLAGLLCRSLGLGSGRSERLRAWTPSSETDFASCVAQIVGESEAGCRWDGTIEDIDLALNKVASGIRFSSPEVRQKKSKYATTKLHDVLGPMLCRMSAREIRWFLKILLKNLHPIFLPETVVFAAINPKLPLVMRIQDDFAGALGFLDKQSYYHDASDSDERDILSEMTDSYVPSIGIKVARPRFHKARSIENCLKLADSRAWSIEPKYDGEYCQIHVNLDKGAQSIQIFSKSGKDSTHDRAKVHQFIKASLGIHESWPDQARFKSKCILEGELVVFDTKENIVLPFHKIRKHVNRSGSFVSAETDSQMHENEALGVIYYDVLRVDDISLIFKPYNQRRSCLAELLTSAPSQSISVSWGTIDASRFSVNPSREIDRLSAIMSKAMTRRCEGLILKALDGPYLSLGATNSRKSDGCVIKMKADYIPGLGDSVDLAVIGGTFDSREAMIRNERGLKWTNFTIACLTNKVDVVRRQTRPTYKAIGTISSAQQCINKSDLEHLCGFGQFVCLREGQDLSDLSFDVQNTPTVKEPATFFRSPFVVEVLGSGFDKPAANKHFMLRHPRIVKMHSDRSREDVVSFDELQDLAIEAMNIPEDLRNTERESLNRLRTVGQRKKQVYVNQESPGIVGTTDGTNSTKTSPHLPDPHKMHPPPIVRVDTQDLLPGETRNGSSPYPETPQMSQSTSRNERSPSECPISPLSNMPSSSRNSKRSSGVVDKHDPAAKRHKIASQNPQPHSASKSHVLSSSAPNRTMHRSPKKLTRGPLPLGDITNDNNRLISPPRPRSWHQRRQTATKPPQNTTQNFRWHKPSLQAIEVGERQSCGIPRDLSTHIASRMSDHSSPSLSPSYNTAPSNQSSSAPDPSHTVDSSTTPSDRPPRTLQITPFTTHTFHLSPCISAYLWLTEDLLTLFPPAHSTSDLSHWNRELLDVEPLGPVVSESQAYPGLQKAVLVEPKRKTATNEFVERVRDVQMLGEEVIEVWDWRILDDFAGLLDRGSERAGRLAPWPGDVTNALVRAMVETKLLERFVGVIRKGGAGVQGKADNIFEEASPAKKFQVAKRTAGEWLRES